MKKYLALMLAVLMVIGIVGGCAKKTDSSSPVKIGVITPQTGEVAVYGVAVANGVKMALDEINAAGGVLGGRKIEATYLDDKKDSTEAANCFNKLLSSGVCAIIGSVTSGITAGLGTLANQNKMLLLTPTATADTITEGLPTVFRACYADSYQSSICAKFAYENLKCKKAGVLYASGDAYSAGMYEGFKTAAEKLGMTVVAESTSATADTDYSTQLTNLVAAGVEVIFAPFYYSSVGPYIVPQARAAGFKGPMIGADGWDGTADVMVQDKTLYNNTYFSNHYAADDPSDVVQKFVKGYDKLYGATPNALAALGYDSAYMLAQAINAAKSDKTADIIKAMTGMSFKGVTGSFTLDAKNTPTKSCAMIEFVNGAMKWKATVG